MPDDDVASFQLATPPGHQHPEGEACTDIHMILLYMGRTDLRIVHTNIGSAQVSPRTFVCVLSSSAGMWARSWALRSLNNHRSDRCLLAMLTKTTTLPQLHAAHCTLHTALVVYTLLLYTVAHCTLTSTRPSPVPAVARWCPIGAPPSQHQRRNPGKFSRTPEAARRAPGLSLRDHRLPPLVLHPLRKTPCTGPLCPLAWPSLRASVSGWKHPDYAALQPRLLLLRTPPSSGRVAPAVNLTSAHIAPKTLNAPRP